MHLCMYARMYSVYAYVCMNNFYIYQQIRLGNTCVAGSVVINEEFEFKKKKINK